LAALVPPCSFVPSPRLCPKKRSQVCCVRFPMQLQEDQNRQSFLVMGAQSWRQDAVENGAVVASDHSPGRLVGGQKVGRGGGLGSEGGVAEWGPKWDWAAKLGGVAFAGPSLAAQQQKSSRVTVERPGTRNRRLGPIPTTALRIATSRYPSNPSIQYCGNYRRREYHVSSVLGKAHQLWSCPKPRFAARGGSRWTPRPACLATRDCQDGMERSTRPGR